MSYNAEILADSINPQGDRITTMKVTFPRMVLAEFNTHRMFSRNSASSRAIPFKKMVKMVEENPFIPIAWQKDHKGMQGTEYICNQNGQGGDEVRIEVGWIQARDKAIEQATWMNDYGCTKQLCNRLLEPFMWHTVIITATEFENFFKLRCPEYYGKFRSWKDASNLGGATFETPFYMRDNSSQADIHIQAIAELMWDAINESTPKELKAGEWHIPNFKHNWDEEWLKKYVSTVGGTIQDYEDEIRSLKIKISVAHCARISYQTLGGNPKIDYEADIRLHDILTSNGHESPLEHIGKACDNSNYYYNLKGFKSYRYLFNKNYK